MNKVLAIAGIAMRNAVRSRVVAVLLLLLLVAILALPLTIKGDGTLTGAVQVLLRYTLGAVTIILSVATLWAGCAAIATEIQDRQVHLIVTKPVHRLELWLGKWLGLVALNAVLLTLAGGVTYGLLRWNLRPERLAAREQQQLREEILVARRRVRPDPFPIEETAQKIFTDQQRRGELPAHQPADQVLEAIRQTLTRQANSIPPGFAVRYVFRLPRLPAADRPLILRYKFASSATDNNPVACMLVAGAPDRPDRMQREEFTAPGGVHSVAIPRALLAADRTLTVDIANIDPRPVTMVFTPGEGVELLAYEGTFAGNLARALLVTLCQLGFLAALGVTLGSLFSLPVAALAAGYVVLLTNLGPYLKTLATGGDAHWPLRGVYVGLYWVSQPFQTPSALEALATGELVSGWWVGSAVLWQVIVSAGVLATLGAWLFNRRELGLPA